MGLAVRRGPWDDFGGCLNITPSGFCPVTSCQAPCFQRRSRPWAWRRRVRSDRKSQAIPSGHGPEARAFFWLLASSSHSPHRLVCLNDSFGVSVLIHGGRKTILGPNSIRMKFVRSVSGVLLKRRGAAGAAGETGLYSGSGMGREVGMECSEKMGFTGSGRQVSHSSTPAPDTVYFQQIVVFAVGCYSR
jgi:hypothetical protein